MSKFTYTAINTPHPFRLQFRQDGSKLCENIIWECTSSQESVEAFRTHHFHRLEAIKNGVWGDANLVSDGQRYGALWDQVLSLCDYSDKGVGSLFAEGARILGVMGGPTSWPEIVRCEPDPEAWSRQQILEWNSQNRGQLIASIRPSKFDNELWDTTMNDVQAGNMEGPFFSEEEVRVRLGGEFVVSRRFGVEQSDKVRECDDCFRSNLNRGTRINRRLKLSGVDNLFWAAGLATESSGPGCLFWKRDHKKSYRQVPVHPADWPLLVVVFWDARRQRPAFFFHKKLPFGAVAAVYAYNRVANALIHIARAVLNLPVDNYFDDFWGVGGTLIAARRGFDWFGRLNNFLGLTLKEEKDFLPASTGVLLGVSVSIGSFPFLMCVDEDRARRLLVELDRVCQNGAISPAEAGSLAGKLQFAASAFYGRVGRAAIAPLFEIQSSKRATRLVSPQLREGFLFLAELMQNPHPREYYGNDFSRPSHVLFTDASGSGRMCGVLFTQGQERPLVVAGQCDNRILESLLPREDKQITLLELLAVLHSVAAFSDIIASSDLTIYVDNEGAKGMIVNGFARGDCLDGTVVASMLWRRIAALHAAVFVDRVPSDSNVADGPTRPDKPSKSEWLFSLHPQQFHLPNIAEEVAGELKRCLPTGGKSRKRRQASAHAKR